MDLNKLSEAGILFLILLSSLALHEFAHAWVADKRGDPLPRAQGRVTLDPFAHLDPIGSLLIPGVMIFLPVLTSGMFPVALIGWGKPVQISLPNPATRRTDDILITLAGPAMNLLIASVASVVAGVLFGLEHYEPANRFFVPVISLNVMLIVFNLIPVPPLDGSRVMRHVVGMGEEAYMRFASFGWIILLVLVNMPWFCAVLDKVLKQACIPFFETIYFIARLIGG